METITSTDGTPIAYERTGSGPPLVRVHGTTADHASWEPVRDAFAERFTLYLVDRRGRGGSGDAEGFAIEREFEDVAAVVDAIDDPVVLVGHSYGALCALEGALRTDGLRALVLYEPPIPVGEHELYSPAVHEELAGLLAAGDAEGVLERFLRDVARVPSADVDAIRETPLWERNAATASTIPREYAASGTYEFEPERFESLTTPTLLVTGGESPAFLRDATATVAAALPDSRVTVLDGREHLAMLTAPAEYAEAVFEFLDGLA